MSLVDAVYIAGFIDGEGSIMILKRKNGTLTIRVTIANCVREVLDWVQTATGVGTVITRPHKNKKHRDGFWFVCNAEAAESLLKQIRPYLRIKGAQADLALESQEKLRDPKLRADRTWQAIVSEKCSFLNRRGPRLETV